MKSETAYQSLKALKLLIESAETKGELDQIAESILKPEVIPVMKAFKQYQELQERWIAPNHPGNNDRTLVQLREERQWYEPIEDEL